MPFFCLRSFWSTKQAFLPELSSAFVPGRALPPAAELSCLFTKDRDPSFLNVVLFIERLRRSLVQFTRKSIETSFILFPHELIVKSRDPLPSVAFSCLFTKDRDPSFLYNSLYFFLERRLVPGRMRRELCACPPACPPSCPPAYPPSCPP
jgi:hypothetical protein